MNRVTCLAHFLGWQSSASSTHVMVQKYWIMWRWHGVVVSTLGCHSWGPRLDSPPWLECKILFSHVQDLINSSEQKAAFMLSLKSCADNPFYSENSPSLCLKRDLLHRSRVKSVIRPALYHQATTAGSCFPTSFSWCFLAYVSLKQKGLEINSLQAIQCPKIP